MSTNIPWIHGYEWEEMKKSLETSFNSLGDGKQRLLDIAACITGHYQKVDVDLQILAEKSCAWCDEVCCERATVWYDFKDLLYIYCAKGNFPPHQIFRHNNASCCHLTSTGCHLNRADRPFICTWYICAQQKRSLDSTLQAMNLDLCEIEQIKSLRKKLVRVYKELLTSNRFYFKIK